MYLLSRGGHGPDSVEDIRDFIHLPGLCLTGELLGRRLHQHLLPVVLYVVEHGVEVALVLLGIDVGSLGDGLGEGVE